MSHANAEDIKKHVQIYLRVFAALAVLTVVTVAIGQIHLTIRNAIIVAMFVALIKGTLVAGYFMHLFSERKIIYATLVLCALFFVVLMTVPSLEVGENVVVAHITPTTEAPPAEHHVP